jgi:polyhydroxybutyrate depolymerase
MTFSHKHRPLSTRLAESPLRGPAFRLMAAGLIVAIASGVGGCRATRTSATHARATLMRDSFNTGPWSGRSWLSYAPAGLAPGAPLVVVLHGGGGSAENSATSGPTTRWKQIADSQPGGLMVIYPDGTKGPNRGLNWNDCRSDEARPGGETNDVGFLSALIEQAPARWGTDPRHVLVTGISNGGMMTLRMAAERPLLVSAAGVIAASMPVEHSGSCGRPTDPVRLAMIQGTADPLMPFGGGPIQLQRVGVLADRGDVIGVDATARLWRTANKAQQPGPTRRLPDLDPSDGLLGRDSTAQEQTWTGASGSALVVQITVMGGGHTIPDTTYPDPLPRLLVGAQNRDFDTASEIWHLVGWPTATTASRHPPSEPGPAVVTRS